MRTAGGSWWEKFVEAGKYLIYPQPLQSVTWLPVSQGQVLAKLDPGRNHLHRSVRHTGNGAEYSTEMVLPSIPSWFDNYQRFREDVPQECRTNAAHWQNDDCWLPVLRGMPRKGQVLRRVY